MSSQFVGLPIRVELSNGNLVEGIIVEIDKSNGKLKLGQAHYRRYDGSLLPVKDHLIIDKDTAKDLTLLSVQPNSTQSNKPTNESSGNNISQNSRQRQTNASENRNSETHQSNTRYHNHDHHPETSQAGTSDSSSFDQQQPQRINRTKSSLAAPKPTSPDSDPLSHSTTTITNSHHNQNPHHTSKKFTSASASNRRRKAQKNVPKALRSTSRYRESDPGPESELSAREDYSAVSSASPVYGFRNENQPDANQTSNFDLDFDFQAGLKAFDKAKLWAEIALTDSTDPADRLVAHNRKQPDKGSSRGAKLKDSTRSRNLGRNEMVLSAKEQVTNGSAVYATFSHPPPQNNNQSFILSSDGRPIYPVKLARLNEALNRASVEYGPNLVQRVENASRSTAEYVIRLLRLSQHNSSKSLKNATIAVIVGCQGSKGSSAVRSGTLLANKGFSVVLYLTNESGDGAGSLPKSNGARNQAFEFQLRLFRATGATVTSDINDLPSSPAMIIEALSENSITKLNQKQSKVFIDQGLMSYTHCAPTLSIDTPSYTSYDTGESLIENNKIGFACQHLVCLGALPEGVLRMKVIPSEVCLIDLTLPSICWNEDQEDEEDDDDEEDDYEEDVQKGSIIKKEQLNKKNITNSKIKKNDKNKIRNEDFLPPSTWGDKWFTLLNM